MTRFLSAFSSGRGATGAGTARRRNLLAVSLAAFLASVGFMVVMPVLPGLLQDVGAGGAIGVWLGLAISVSPLLTAVTGPFWATLGERYGRKAMIQRSLVCIGIGIGLMSLAQLPIHVIGLRAVIGGLGGVSVAALAAVTATTPRRELGSALGMLQAAQTAGAMVGPLIGGLLGALVGMRASFVAAAVIFVCAITLVQLLYREGAAAASARAVAAEAEADGEAKRGGVFTPAVLVALLAAFGAQFVEGSFIVALPLELERLGVEPDALPWVLGTGLSLTYLAATVAAALGGRLVAGRSATTLLRYALLLGMLALVPLALAATWWQFLGARIVLALLAGAAPTLAYSAAAGLAAPERRARVVSLASSAGILGFAASPLVAGALVQVDGRLLLALDAALYGLLALALLATERGLFDGLRRRLAGGGSAPGRGLAALLPNVAVPGRRAGEPSGGLAGLGRFLSVERRYTATEVLAALRGEVEGARAEAVMDVVSRPAEWLPAHPDRVFSHQRYADRLPTILLLYRRGESPVTIERRYSTFGGGWAVEQTVETAAKLIAKRLNR